MRAYSALPQTEAVGLAEVEGLGEAAEAVEVVGGLAEAGELAELAAVSVNKFISEFRDLQHLQSELSHYMLLLINFYDIYFYNIFLNLKKCNKNNHIQV